MATEKRVTKNWQSIKAGGNPGQTIIKSVYHETKKRFLDFNDVKKLKEIHETLHRAF